MKRLLSLFPVLGLVVACAGGERSSATTASLTTESSALAPVNGACAYTWELLPTDTPVLALDRGATYYGLRLAPPDDDLAFELAGTLPDSRYMSVTTYDPLANAYDSIYDAKITPAGASYTIQLLPGAAEGGADGNLRRIAASSKGAQQNGFTIWYREYVASGPVSPPTLRAYSLRTGAPRACPPALEGSTPLHPILTATAAEVPEGSPDGSFESYRIAGAYDYQNNQNGYLHSSVGLTSREAIVYRYQAPTAATTYSVAHPDGSAATSNVRYDSVSLVGDGAATLASLKDADIPVADDPETATERAATILVGDSANTGLQQYAADHGFAFLGLPLGVTSTHFNLIYRQQAPNAFPGNVQTNVPTCGDADAGSTCNPASCAIGSYAPRGRVCAVSDVLAGACPVSLAKSTCTALR